MIQERAPLVCSLEGIRLLVVLTRCGADLARAVGTDLPRLKVHCLARAIHIGMVLTALTTSRIESWRRRIVNQLPSSHACERQRRRFRCRRFTAERILHKGNVHLWRRCCIAGLLTGQEGRALKRYALHNPLNDRSIQQRRGVHGAQGYGWTGAATALASTPQPSPCVKHAPASQLSRCPTVESNKPLSSSLQSLQGAVCTQCGTPVRAVCRRREVSFQ